MAPHSSNLAWKIPWMEEPGRLQSMGLLRVWHDWATSLSLFTFMHWRRKWQPTPVFLPGESQGRGSLVGCCLWGRTESDATEVTGAVSTNWECSSKRYTTWLASHVRMFFPIQKQFRNIYSFNKIQLRHKWRMKSVCLDLLPQYNCYKEEQTWLHFRSASLTLPPCAWLPVLSHAGSAAL